MFRTLIFFCFWGCSSRCNDHLMLFEAFHLKKKTFGNSLWMSRTGGMLLPIHGPTHITEEMTSFCEPVLQFTFLEFCERPVQYCTYCFSQNKKDIDCWYMIQAFKQSHKKMAGVYIYWCELPWKLSYFRKKHAFKRRNICQHRWIAVRPQMTGCVCTDDRVWTRHESVSPIVFMHNNCS